MSTGSDQLEAGATATTASGSLDQLQNLSDVGFQLNNGTCANYFVQFQVLGTALPTLDAGTDAPAAPEAGGDAPHD